MHETESIAVVPSMLLAVDQVEPLKFATLPTLSTASHSVVAAQETDFRVLVLSMDAAGTVGQ